MKFPILIENNYKCFNCDKPIISIACYKCKIYYINYSIDFYLNDVDKALTHTISKSSGIVYSSKNLALFNISECKDFKEVMNRIHKLMIFS